MEGHPQALARGLGFEAGARVLIAHADDVGMCHGANRAFAELAGAGFITCGSVMVPCPWFPEVAELAAARPELDLGVHLTLTSEWPRYRWRPISTASRASGLIDGDGYMWRRVPELRARVAVRAAEAELRAQIDAALAAGIDVTHLDTHMGAALAPELVGLYLRLGREYRLPVLFPRRIEPYAGVLNMGDGLDPDAHAARAAALERDGGVPVVDHFVMTPVVPREESEAAYRRLVQALPRGVTFGAFHPNAPGDIEAIVPDRAHWRTDEHRLFGDPRFIERIERRGVRLVGFRPIRNLYRSSLAAA